MIVCGRLCSIFKYAVDFSRPRLRENLVLSHKSLSTLNQNNTTKTNGGLNQTGQKQLISRDGTLNPQTDKKEAKLLAKSKNDSVKNLNESQLESPALISEDLKSKVLNSSKAPLERKKRMTKIHFRLPITDWSFIKLIRISKHVLRSRKLLKIYVHSYPPENKAPAIEMIVREILPIFEPITVRHEEFEQFGVNILVFHPKHRC